MVLEKEKSEFKLVKVVFKVYPLSNPVDWLVNTYIDIMLYMVIKDIYANVASPN